MNDISSGICKIGGAAFLMASYYVFGMTSMTEEVVEKTETGGRVGTVMLDMVSAIGQLGNIVFVFLCIFGVGLMLSGVLDVYRSGAFESSSTAPASDASSARASGALRKGMSAEKGARKPVNDKPKAHQSLSEGQLSSTTVSLEKTEKSDGENSKSKASGSRKVYHYAIDDKAVSLKKTELDRE